MRKLLFGLLVIFMLATSGCKEKTYTHIEVNFDENVDLNTMTVTIENDEEYNITGEILYHSEYDLDELYLIMFANTYSSEDRVTVNYLQVNGVDVESEFQGIDRSALHITLENSITAGEVVTISYDMDVIYPDTFRLAHYGTQLYNMYFYPYVAMYDGEFDIDPYSRRGETYYNVLSNYDVTIWLGEDFVVSAPGEHISTFNDGDMTLHRYVLRNARDFSFSACTHYEVYQLYVDGMELEIYSIRSLTPQEQQSTMEYMRKSFEVYKTYIGDFYYDRFVLELGHIYGMESSGIIFCSEEISEGTIVHEIIHQWFFFMIGNDPYDESFLDESLTTYITALYYYDLYGMEGYNGYLDTRDSSLERLSEHWTTYEGSSLLDVPDDMGDGYAFVIYYHGPTLFKEYVHTYLDNDVEEFARILKVYYEEYEGTVATTDEFLSLLEEESGVENTTEWFYFHLNNLQDVSNTP